MLKLSRDRRFLFAIINNMNEGISFKEACELTPGGLTAEQLSNCPGQESEVLTYVLMAIAAITIAILGFVVYRTIKSKKS